MADGADARGNDRSPASEAQLQDEFLQEKPRSEDGVHPRMSLSRASLTFFFLVIIVRSGLQVLADHPVNQRCRQTASGRGNIRFLAVQS